MKDHAATQMLIALSVKGILDDIDDLAPLTRHISPQDLDSLEIARDKLNRLLELRRVVAA